MYLRFEIAVFSPAGALVFGPKPIFPNSTDVYMAPQLISFDPSSSSYALAYLLFERPYYTLIKVAYLKNQQPGNFSTMEIVRTWPMFSYYNPVVTADIGFSINSY